MNFGCCNPSLKCKIVGDMAVMQAPCPPPVICRMSFTAPLASDTKNSSLSEIHHPKTDIFSLLLQSPKISSIKRKGQKALCKNVGAKCRRLDRRGHG